MAATGVFGAPITLDTVRSTALYPKPITQRNCSEVALLSINDAKALSAAQFVDNLKSNYGSGISAKCLIYNATGTTLEYYTCKDFHGHVHGSPYPQTIMNGQWGAFLHVHGFLEGSVGAVVYRSLRPDQKDQYCDWAFSWNIPFGSGSNTVYTSIREAGHFSVETTFWEKYLSIGYGDWTGFAWKLGRSGSVTEDKNYGYSSKIMIAGGTTAEVRGTFQMSPP